jgi:hypothetical protein
VSDQLPAWVWPTVLLGVCGLAVMRGRDLERLAAGGYLAAWALSLVAYQAYGEDAAWVLLAIDTLLLGLVTYIAMISVRFWPMLVSAVQLLAVATYLARTADSGINTWTLLTAVLAWNYLALATIGYGAWTAPRRYAEIEAPREVPGATRR